VRSRIFGEQFNDKLRLRVVNALKSDGFAAVAPLLAPEFRTLESDAFYLASTWSERHIAHACGLGTFGLCDGLITRVGKAVRFGSVVAEIQVVPDERPYTDHREYCLFAAEGTCGECIDRCPVDALSKEGHDKQICRKYQQEYTRPYVKKIFKLEGYGCGLCQTGVPCESGIPESRKSG
jgi:epoxyqueuosine reductase QueG